MTPHGVQAVAIHSLERETHGHLEAGKEHPRHKLIGTRVACGSGASSAIVLPNGPIQSPDVILFNVPHPLPPATHTKHMQTDTTLPSPSAVMCVCAHTHTHTSVVCRADGGLVEVLSVLCVCLVHSQLTGSPMSTPSCHHSTSHGSLDTPVST